MPNGSFIELTIGNIFESVSLALPDEDGDRGRGRPTIWEWDSKFHVIMESILYEERCSRKRSVKHST